MVLFNRFLEPDIDLKTILSSQTDVSLAATSGIHNVSDLVKAILAGAHVGMLASALLKHGPAFITELLERLHDWLAEHEYVSSAQLTGSMNRSNCPNTSAFERANYAKALVSFTERIE